MQGRLPQGLRIAIGLETLLHGKLAAHKAAICLIQAIRPAALLAKRRAQKGRNRSKGFARQRLHLPRIPKAFERLRINSMRRPTVPQLQGGCGTCAGLRAGIPRDMIQNHAFAIKRSPGHHGRQR